MKNLRQVIAQYAVVPPSLGTRTAPVPALDPNRLRRDLQKVSDGARTSYWVCVAMLVILFCGECAILLHYMRQPSLVEAIFGLAGVSIVGVAYRMVALWKERIYTEMTLALVVNLSPENMREILELVLQKIK